MLLRKKLIIYTMLHMRVLTKLVDACLKINGFKYI